MHLEGTKTLQAPLGKVWEMLLNPKILEKIIPSLKSLESTGNDQYKALFEVKMGPVNGSFNGTMEVADQKPQESFKLIIKQNSKIGNVSAEGSILLKNLNANQTEVIFSGDAKLSGTLARTGQRVLSGVANTLTDQFFLALENEINASQGLAVKKRSWLANLIRMIRIFFGFKPKD
jgi:carbon monoxide dehydrogenase subunit G